MLFHLLVKAKKKIISNKNELSVHSEQKGVKTIKNDKKKFVMGLYLVISWIVSLDLSKIYTLKKQWRNNVFFFQLQILIESHLHSVHVSTFDSGYVF